tara:strand:- start:1418 stop:1672 length:255 start_codon:yes stop_codon:yes gene_type:complete
MPFYEKEGEFITREETMEKYVKVYKYLVIKADTSIGLYKSLRRIQKDILVDASTISKKLKENGGDHCICTSKPMNYVFYIKKLT